MTKNAYLVMEIMLIRSQTDHLFAVCLFTAKWGSFSLFWIYLDTFSRQYYHIASAFLSNLYLLGSLYIKVGIEKYILVTLNIIINV